MSPEQHCRVVHLLQVVMINRKQTQFLQTFHLTAIVHNVAQAIKVAMRCQHLFCFLNSRGHSKTESRAFIYLYKHVAIILNLTVYPLQALLKQPCILLRDGHV